MLHITSFSESPSKNPPKKIHIIGSVGSGKTTLARKLSSELTIPHFELDNVVWIRDSSGDIRRTDKERDDCLCLILSLDSWIIEGVHHKWVDQSFQNADLILFLDTGYRKRTARIFKRFIFQKLGLEKANYKPTFKMFWKMFEWNAFFEKESKQEILNILSKYGHKLVILKDNTEFKKN